MDNAENIKQDGAEAEEQLSTPAEPTAEDAHPAEERLPELEAKAAEYLDGWQRARAELVNYKKRVERDRATLRDDLIGELALKVLAAVDDFDLVVRNQPAELADNEWAKSVLMAHKRLAAQLESLGLEEIEAEGQPFDPARHEAVMQQASPDHEPGTVIDVLRKGYSVGERIIRPALVRVAQ